MSVTKEEKRLRPILDYINTLTLIKDMVKSEAKAYLFKVISSNAPLIAKIFVDSIPKEPEILHRKLRNLVIPVLDITKKYKDGAWQASSIYAKSVISKINRERARKSFFDWLEAVDKKEKEIEKKSEDILINRIENATQVYELQTKSLLSDLFLIGNNKNLVEESLASNIKSGNRETGTFFNAIAEGAGSYIWQVADMAANEAFQEEDLTRMKWTTFFAHSCHECEDLHGKVKTYEKWLWHGLPRSGVTVCRSHCHCVLLPVEYPIEISKPMSLASGREILQRVNEERSMKTGKISGKTSNKIGAGKQKQSQVDEFEEFDEDEEED